MTDLHDLLREFWGIRPATVDLHEGGMNSETWLVEDQGATYVAKRVPVAETTELVEGCAVAAALADCGFVTGRPVPTTDGRLVVTEHALALLELVPGRALEGETDEEQRWIADTLAGIHTAGGPAIAPSAATFAADWLCPPVTGFQAHPWLAPAIEAVRAETDQLTVTWSVLHTDPSPEAFIHDDSTAVTGLIDWAGARRGPVMYDVASAVMYLGGPHRATTFLATYRRHGPLGSDELALLDTYRRFRWVIQAAYFARRLATRDLTGLTNHAGNTKGLNDARQGLSALGVDTV